jgi:plasmid stabilization system protein ParE
VAGATYRMTPTARAHLEKAVRDTGKQWGIPQARTYLDAFRKGLQDLAERHCNLHSPHRAALAAGTAFSVHLVEHRYVAFQVHDAKTIIIAGIFHESMDIPNRLLELENMTQPEIAALKHRIANIRRTRKG